MAGSAKRDGGGPIAGTPGSAKALGVHGGPVLDRVIQAQIGDKLRAMYGELIDQPVPDRLTAILARIASDAGRGTGS